MEAAIYERDFYGANSVSELAARKPITKLTAPQIKSIETLLAEGDFKSPDFLSRGIPDRALILPTQKVQIVYGGNTGDEIVILDLQDNSLRRIFQSHEFLQRMQEIEGKNIRFSDLIVILPAVALFLVFIMILILMMWFLSKSA